MSHTAPPLTVSAEGYSTTTTTTTTTAKTTAAVTDPCSSSILPDALVRGGPSAATAAITAPTMTATPGTADLMGNTSPTSTMDSQNPHDGLLKQQSQQNPSAVLHDIGGQISSQSIPLTVTNSQESHITSSSGHAMTPPASDISSVTDGGAVGRGGRGTSSVGTEPSLDSLEKSDHLMHLSTIAAAQNRIAPDAAVGVSRKRMADGGVKAHIDTSPAKGHSRNISTVSMASTGSTIGELSAELKTRLSYAMVKVNYGWQGRSIEEVESLASQAVSPSSSSSTLLHKRHDSSTSPRLAVAAAPAHVHFARETSNHTKADFASDLFFNKPTLAPPATIQPSSSMPAPQTNSRRNSSPRYTPAMLAYSQSHSASPHTPAAQDLRSNARANLPNGAHMADPILFPSHQNVREQDAIESLLFMSSPNNSANLKHTFSPSGSPGPQAETIRGGPGRHALPSGPRKGLPSHKPSPSYKRAAFDKSPGVLHPSASPMDVDSPQHSYYSPNRATPKRRVKGTTNHLRVALSLPTGLGGSHSAARRVLRDEDIERMLDRAGAEAADSSDDEEIQLPHARNGVMDVRG